MEQALASDAFEPRELSERLFHYVKFMPSRQNPSGTLDRDTIEAGIAAAVAEQNRTT